MPRGGINYYFIPLPSEHKDRRQNAIDELLSQLRLREVGEGLVLYGLPEKCRALFDALEPYLMEKCDEWASKNGQVVKQGPAPLAYRLEPSDAAAARPSQTTVVIPLFNTQCEVVLVDLAAGAVEEHTITWKPDWVLHLDDGTGFKVRHGSVRFIYVLLDLEKQL